MEITENKLITRLARFGKASRDVLRGIGDDGAVVKLKDGQYVFVQDAMVENIHFDLAIQKIGDVGKKAVYSNISDILAMGALPRYYLITLGIPTRIKSSVIGELYRGMDRAAREFDVLLLGGDTVETREDFFIDLSMTGRLKTAIYLGRNKAMAGDLIGVTGFLGESAYGLHLLKEQGGGRSTNRFIKRFVAPRPPLETWKALTDAKIIRAMMDISDGLLIDLERMMKESGKGAVIHLEHVPIPAVLRKEGKEMLSLAGGEDYQLLFTFDRSHLPIIEAIQKNHDVSVIGEVQSGKGVRLYEQGKLKKVAMKGYEHFKGAR